MSAGWFLFWWVLFCASMFGLIACGVNFDRVAVFFLSALNLPVYLEARRVAALLYQHPEQWRIEPIVRNLFHPTVGAIEGINYPSNVHVVGPYGRWEPTRIEKRIIWNAVQWWQHAYIGSLLMKAMDG